jgi:hypothetical protein
MQIQMMEVLYRTDTPQSSIRAGEFFQLCVCLKFSAFGKPGFFLEEIHGWWDESDKKLVHKVVTLSPEKGSPTLVEVLTRYDEQVKHRAREGFVYSFRIDPYSARGYVCVKIA